MMPGRFLTWAVADMMPGRFLTWAVADMMPGGLAGGGAPLLKWGPPLVSPGLARGAPPLNICRSGRRQSSQSVHGATQTDCETMQQYSTVTATPEETGDDMTQPGQKTDTDTSQTDRTHHFNAMWGHTSNTAWL